MGPKLKKSLRRPLGAREELVPPGRAPHLFLNEKGSRVTENTPRRRLYKLAGHSGIRKARTTSGAPLHLVPEGEPRTATNLSADEFDGKSEEDFYAAGSKVAD